MSPTCTNSHYDNHATFVPSINHNKDVALLSYVELYIYIYITYVVFEETRTYILQIPTYYVLQLYIGQ